MKIKKFFICFLGYWCAVNFLSGCATIPTRETLPTYNINGTTYLPLIPLCEQRGIALDYDTFTRAATLTKDAHKINLRAGDNLVLVDNSPLHLKAPVDIYQGAVVVPYRFKEQVLDALFKKVPAGKVVMPQTLIKKVVIDAGHGGTDPGAIGRTGLREKHLTLDIAKRLSKLLKEKGIAVVMTRSTDNFISLSRRVGIANGSGADLFISIHANANRVRSLNGFEVYYVSPQVNDSRRALSAAENAVLNLDRSCFANQSLNLKAILWDMIYTYNRAESIELSRALCRTAGTNLNTPVLGIKGANFYVLKGARTPAVLIEIGFLSNYNEERRLKNSYYRQEIAEAIAQGIYNYARNYTLAEVN